MRSVNQQHRPPALSGWGVFYRPANQTTLPMTPLRKPIHRKTRRRRSAAMDWLGRFVAAPKYNPDWDVARTTAFLNIYETAMRLQKKTHPDHLAACVLRHRIGLLSKKDALLISAIAFMPPKVLTSLTCDASPEYANFNHLSQKQIAALDPTAHDIDTQCAATPSTSSKPFIQKAPKPSRATATQHGARR